MLLLRFERSQRTQRKYRRFDTQSARRSQLLGILIEENNSRWAK